MKRISASLIAVVAFGVSLCIPMTASAAFSSGSTGTDGALAPTTNTVLTIPSSGVFNFTTINIPNGITVTFLKDTNNSPIIMLASGDVTINGSINVSGANGTDMVPGQGGPGGYNGAIGGGTYQSGRRGEGPGGGGYGSPRTDTYYSGGGGGGGGYSSGGGGGGGSYVAGGGGGSTYGNEKILPLIGGSGGGGGGGTNTYIGGSGGGGGGAILIASSGTIYLNGSIQANGGAGSRGGNPNSGGGGGSGGSGGSIRLIANYIQGSGSLSAAGGGGVQNYNWGGGGGVGRIRLEAITVATSITTNPSPASIVQNISDSNAIFPTNIPTLTIASVGGVSVPAKPKGLTGSPDVSIPFNIANPVSVVVNANNVPVGTTVTVKSSPSQGGQTSATGTLAGTIDSSSASISLNISTSFPSVLTASVTLVVSAANGGPIYAEGEKVEKMRIETAMGGESKVFYITESGREIPAKKLGAS